VSSKMKQWVAMAAVGALVIAVGGWFLLVSPKRSNATSLRAQTAERQRANADLSTALAALKAQAKNLPKQQAKLAAVAAKVPDNSALPTLIRALNAAADNAGVELVTMSPSAPTPVTAAATTVKAGAAPTGGLQQIGVTLNVVGSYFQVSEYLDRLETLTRAFRVTGLALSPGANPVKPADSQPSADTGKVLSAAITGQVYELISGTPTTATTGK
jgi:Tfp pilus assembly protein PilO